jgi:hypothetical protein
MLDILTKSVYGVDRHYPANKKAEAFSKLLNKKTFSVQDLMTIKHSIGYRINFVNNQPEI